MEMNTDKQLELFSQSKGALQAKKSSAGSFFTCVRGYEKTILIILCIVVSIIISFSLGVETGKKLSVAKLNIKPAVPQVKPAVIEANPQESITQNYQIQPPVIKKEEAIRQTVPLNMQNYTIQLASYKTRSSAEKEAQDLKRKGFFPLVLTKGSYVILCVGNFSSKETAQPLLSELQKRYKGCYIRRL